MAERLRPTGNRDQDQTLLAKTLKSYRAWIRQLHVYVQNRPPHSLTTDDVKAFLSFLAVEKQVSVSSQNQTFNALLFLFRND